jgi:hypothetical protein
MQERMGERGARGASKGMPERAFGRGSRGASKGRPGRIGGRGAVGRPSGPMKQDAPPPKLAVVSRPTARKPGRPAKPAAPAPVTEFAGAKAGASAKDLALFELERARVAVHAAIQGLGAAGANRPTAKDKWSVRQIVLHLAFWDREIVQKYLEAAAARNQRAGIRRPEIEVMNTDGLATLEHHDWESAKRLFQTTHDALWDALDSIPADPPDVWSRGHAVGELVWEITKHDRHHADAIKRWRADSGT